MSQIVDIPATQSFVERRARRDGESSAPGRERRQFVDGREELSVEARELAEAVDRYKLVHRRRFITYEELLGVVQSLGYHR